MAASPLLDFACTVSGLQGPDGCAPGALRVSCADKPHNARAIQADYEVEGERLRQRFTAKSKALKLEYYE